MLRRTGARPTGGRAAAVGTDGAEAGGGEEHEFVFDEIDFVGGLDAIAGDSRRAPRCPIVF